VDIMEIPFVMPISCNRVSVVR